MTSSTCSRKKTWNCTTAHHSATHYDWYLSDHGLCSAFKLFLLQVGTFYPYIQYVLELDTLSKLLGALDAHVTNLAPKTSNVPFDSLAVVMWLWSSIRLCSACVALRLEVHRNEFGRMLQWNAKIEIFYILALQHAFTWLSVAKQRKQNCEHSQPECCLLGTKRPWQDCLTQPFKYTFKHCCFIYIQHYHNPDMSIFGYYTLCTPSYYHNVHFSLCLQTYSNLSSFLFRLFYLTIVTSRLNL